MIAQTPVAEHSAPLPGFADRLVAWQRAHGRHDLPWQQSRDPYRVWLAEIMLQQTQVSTVIPYYRRFLERFPDLAALAAAPEVAVLACWSGLGYYSRARNLHRAAQLIMREHGGRFPPDPAALAELPGIGRSTAAAIAVFAGGARAAILDGNVKRVLARSHLVAGFPGDRRVEQALWALAEALLPDDGLVAYTQGLMDLGATVCRRGRPDCPACPLVKTCRAHAAGRVGELPTPRPKRALPEKSVALLIIRHAGEIALLRRPPTGVWPGLWSLPEAEADADPLAMVRRRFAILDGECRPLAELRHTFTHFRLRIRPWLIDATRRTPQAEEVGTLWLAPRDALEAAIPAPVRRLLRQFG